MTKCLGLYVQHLFCNTVKGMNLLTFKVMQKKKKKWKDDYCFGATGIYHGKQIEIIK